MRGGSLPHYLASIAQLFLVSSNKEGKRRLYRQGDGEMGGGGALAGAPMGNFERGAKVYLL